MRVMRPECLETCRWGAVPLDSTHRASSAYFYAAFMQVVIIRGNPSTRQPPNAGLVETSPLDTGGVAQV